MAGFGEYSGYNRPYYLDTNSDKDMGDVYDSKFQNFYGYKTPASEEFQGPPLVTDENTDEEASAMITTAVSAATIITENLLSHPFIVLRRQCQVHNKLTNYHIVPYTLLPVIVRLQSRQNVTTLWKGIGSSCIVKGLNMAVDDLVMKVTSWPKDVGKCHTVLAFCQHLLLKSISIALVTPFYSASLVETVQSDIASDKPGLFDVFREGGMRLLEWGTPSKGRMLPIWAIVLPTVAFGIAKYCFHISFRNITYKILRFQQRNRYEVHKSYHDNGISNPITENIRLKANLVAFISSEVVFYPIETIIHRLQIQGTRTIIDNLESGTSVIAILTGYRGFTDCYRTTLTNEGLGGFYKGFGCLILQMSAHIAIIRLTAWVAGEFAHFLKPVKTPDDTETSYQAIANKKYLIN